MATPAGEGGKKKGRREAINESSAGSGQNRPRYADLITESWESGGNVRMRPMKPMKPSATDNNAAAAAGFGTRSGRAAHANERGIKGGRRGGVFLVLCEERRQGLGSGEFLEMFNSRESG